ncbi:MAG: PrsW family intramembrane metalloprotease [Chloroflexi bacterium]|nr:PrsW family intramembrane metalloprotease [Chloroflexota bacterium]
MAAVQTTALVGLALAALPVGMALLAGLPLFAFALLYVLFEGAGVRLLLPGILIYVLFICVPVGLYHAFRKVAGAPSGVFRLPGAIWFGVGTVVALTLGQAALLTESGWIFWLFFLMAAALPPLTALALAAHRLGTVTTWRRVMAGVLSGSLLSTQLTLLLGVLVSILAYLLVLPLREVVAHLLASKSLEDLFYSPALVLLMVQVAVVAPIVEELTKPLAAFLLAKRLRGPAEAFLVGMAGGVGFAILENMLYEAAGARVWAHIAALRGMGGVLHPLNAGLVALGWYGVRHGVPGAWGRLLGLYGLAVGIHALWNGGLVVLYSGIGVYFFGEGTWQLSIYGVGQPGVVMVFMVLEALALWRLLFLVTARLRGPEQPELAPLLALHLEQPRRLAVWATGVLVLLVPLGALYGPLLARYGEHLRPFR